MEERSVAQAFTINELLLVVGVPAIVAAVILPGIMTGPHPPGGPPLSATGR
jgi:hypothetical protein